VRKCGTQLVVIDPRRSRTAQRADWHLPIRIGTDAALALGVMHILVRDGLCSRDYIASHTLGFERVEHEVLPRFPPERVAAITGLTVSDIERFASLYGVAEAPFIRLGEGMTRLAQGGQALRAVVLLPGVTGAYGRRGGGALLLTAASCELDYDVVRKPSGPAKTPWAQMVVATLRRRSCDDGAKAAFESVWSGAIVLTRSPGGGRTGSAAALLGCDCGRYGK